MVAQWLGCDWECVSASGCALPGFIPASCLKPRTRLRSKQPQKRILNVSISTLILIWLSSDQVLRRHALADTCFIKTQTEVHRSIIRWKLVMRSGQKDNNSHGTLEIWQTGLGRNTGNIPQRWRYNPQRVNKTGSKPGNPKQRIGLGSVYTRVTLSMLSTEWEQEQTLYAVRVCSDWAHLCTVNSQLTCSLAPAHDEN